MVKDAGSEPNRRSRNVVVIARPYCSPYPNSSSYEQYCQQKLIVHIPFRRQEELLNGEDT